MTSDAPISLIIPNLGVTMMRRHSLSPPPDEVHGLCRKLSWRRGATAFLQLHVGSSSSTFRTLAITNTYSCTDIRFCHTLTLLVVTHMLCALVLSKMIEEIQLCYQPKS
ncbi:hypothetical protein NC653_033099 [Populus alba x Populus x berolinensis]|uniref:Uncharacterized protein n=2 Tax=Populus TaxID=3689 RepID=A0A4U5QUL0_POPAL|nr:hypothetical protein NC653_033099 [Populus alba x Populus x berolinensis]TKS14321.1 hypothetical protein D5086_0000043950 [Populus alba]